MATLSPSTATFHKPLPDPFSFVPLPFRVIPCTRSHPLIHLSSSTLFASSLHPHRPSLCFPSNPHSSRPCRPCQAASPGPPQDSDPPSQSEKVTLTGFAASLSKFQDRVQIFLAVLFWMSLFFWASAWDGRSRPNKGSRSRR
ncbi:hypothetical protein CJ030_MR3G026579 [Morella rubra]|uniref:Uncharacterized protein n=1 Tax=Morella rubra TaxID=262757 RepID=A0A6A1W0C9_9ROSI|nr:hypothetical protein CJ030_MR3G026579 [Morella rubra]